MSIIHLHSHQHTRIVPEAFAQIEKETIIDPLFPTANAPGSPTVDLVLHLIIVGVEAYALFQLYRLYKQQQESGASRSPGVSS